MGKRSNFERKRKDFYPTPYDAVLPLLPHLPEHCNFIEPCAGDGRLVNHLQRHHHNCLWAGDIEPQAEGIEQFDCLMMSAILPSCDLIITNPPWERNQDGTGPLHEMIEVFRNHAPTWLLFDAGWMFTGQAKPFLQYCSKIVTVGRVKWIEGSKNGGMEDAAWYLFLSQKTPTFFYGK